MNKIAVIRIEIPEYNGMIFVREIKDTWAYKIFKDLSKSKEERETDIKK